MPLKRIVKSIVRRASLTGADRRQPDANGAARGLTQSLAALSEAGDHRSALELAEQNLEAHSDDRAFVRQVRISAAKAGAISLQRRATQLELATWPDPKVEAQARAQLGRWRETDATWTPTIDVPLSPVEHPVPGRVLHMLKISMPHRQSGYSMRSLYTLVGQRAAGLDPLAVTALDFPAVVGVTGAPAEEDVRGIRHLRLQRDDVPKNQPWDAYLDDWATALAPVVSREQPEIVHVHSGSRGYEAALVGLAVAQATGLPLVYEVRGFFESLWTSDASWAEQSEMFQRRFDTETRCMLAADAVVTLSESMRSEIVRRGVPAERVHVVPNGVETDIFVPTPRDPELVERLRLGGRYVFGYVSNLDHYREGHELLVEAALHLRDRGVPATALIVGDGARRERLEALVDELGARDVVVFTGKVPHDRVLDHYALFDVFVIPRVDERAARLVTPLKPFEAMAAGIPLVTSDLEALREVTGDGQRGRYFRTGDATSLADVLADLYKAPDERLRLAEAARRWVVAERQWSANGQRYREIYDAVRAARGTTRS
ncbi:glycosyltransferase family 4 protein [Intrasporangium sp.]|uniref:glycosyltransferase family 4 protein n=1 Tax=Intrasporangium sp. TaxID=1925024 RepID=UPI00293B83AF|nr:glycosyltransferase family 4 protein [Intrasporangium sp.]MDV3219802.1 glycosyltransferase family 4 protein [Intrasporangium sp.]